MPYLSEVRLVRALLALMMQRAPIGFAFVDTDLRFVLINDVLAGFNGKSPADHIGRTVAEVSDGFGEPAEKAIRTVLDTGEPLRDQRIVVPAVDDPTRQRTFLVHFYRVMTDDDTVLGVGCVVQEVTHERELQARQHDHTVRVEALAALSSQLNASVTSGAVARSIAADGLVALQARYATVALVDPANPTQLLVVQPDSLPDDLVQRYSTVPLDASLPMADAVRRRTTVLLADDAEASAAYPHLTADRHRAGVVATAAIPFLRADGRVFGALAIGWDHRVDFGTEERAFLATVADLCGQALERARLTDAHTELARALQVQLLPKPPEVAGLDLAVTYRPAATGLGFGGDWYDVIDVGARGVAFLVGDVVGHGIEAAARMAEVRSVVATLIRLGVPEDELLPRASEILTPGGEDLLATMAVVLVDTAAGTVRGSVAGHPPPLVRCADGTCHELPVAHHPPVGLRSAPATPVTSPFPVGATLVLFTDGLIERRGEAIAVSIERLTAALGAIAPDVPAAEVAHHLADLPGLAPRTDDLAVAVVRHTG